ncbi:MFS transporter [Rhodococcus triatomae]|uniref:Major Facilitator Superfamily protein n=1 Tax=Rhodococcus triatomae TaxID=300028 RepID=A0A1G8SDK9_9NOCA|nr:MFS transporter [Rhodococcus triatomae]QNG20720.1 MFS transporter [Rhodococcus triatomae]QNG23362.1 MFS transporter [Rhodococcus triatomae]SDJ27261.1 Major Facilitator Superfamily protein [Rhodococcus triatomae]
METQRGRRRQAVRNALHTLRHSPGLGRLTLVRFASQFGDGMFQAALGGAILFNPERHTDPTAIAAGFAVLLLPYSVVGPFAGALLDRWDRRFVLLWANVLRGVLILATAALLFAGAGETPLFVLALAAVGVSRFVLAGVSASLPRVVRQSWLVPTNSVLVTAGTAVAALGAGAAVTVIGIVGAGDRGSGFAVAFAAAGSVLGALAAGSFPRRQLGPDIGEKVRRSAVRAVAAGLKTGATAVWESRGVTTAMIGIGAHRVVFGINTLVMILVLRVDDPDSMLPAGFAGFGLAVAATATGMLAAAATTPFLVPRIGRPRTVVSGLVLTLTVQATLVPILDQGLLLVSALFLGFAGQCIKLSGDASMQIEIDDARRGQVFALQDTVFNLAFLASIAAAATVIAPDGHSPGLVLAGAGCYAAGLVAVALNSRR